MEPFPEIHELVGFFESEPDISNRDVPMFYNRLSFVYHRDGDIVACAIEPGYGEIDITWRRDGRELASFALRGIESLEVIGAPGPESLIARFSQNSILDFVLHTKPDLRIEWGSFVNQDSSEGER